MTNATLTIKNAQIVTMDPKCPAANALTVQKGKIQRLGQWEDMEPLAQAPVLDLAGATVLPGFIDTHMHPTHLGRALLSADVADSASVKDVVQTIRLHAQSQPAQDLVLAGGLHPPELREQRNPTRQELDSAVPDRAVWVYNRGLHYAVLNTVALAAARIPEGIEGILLDGEQDPTGQLVGHALEVARRKLVESWLEQLDPAEIVRRVAQAAIAQGVTTMHALDGRETFSSPGEWSYNDRRPSQSRPPHRAIQALLETEAPVDFVVYYETLDVDMVARLGLPRIGGCILVDGGHEARTAAFLEPYVDHPGSCGKLYFAQQELDEFVWRAHSRGLQIAVHALGDAAIEQALTAYERALERMPRTDHRHRIEHFEFPTPDQVRRAAHLQVMLGLQPAFNHYWPHGHFVNSLGPARAASADPIQSLIQAGLVLGAGSDAPVTPLDPMLGLQAAVLHSRPEERVSIEQALRMFTRDAAYLAFEEQNKGSLEVGKQADMVVLDRNPFDIESQDLSKLRVVMTIQRGRVVFES